MISSWC